jgi:alpha-glucosidase (family GH31 glycosyl hydrolase)
MTAAVMLLLLLELGMLLGVACASPPPPPPLRSVTLGEGARLSVLSSRVLRLEVGGSTDEPTITFPHRDALPVSAYTLTRTATLLTLATAEVELRLALPLSATALGCERLNATFVGASAGPSLRGRTVCPGEARGRVPTDPAHPGVVMDSWTDILRDTDGNLNGSVDTTDCYCGAACCYGVLQSRMQPGLLSRAGVGVVDDSATALWDNSFASSAAPEAPGEAGWQWRRPRPAAAAAQQLDLYFFLHGHDYRGALRDFVSLAGRTPLKPWKAHGVWWSREYPFNESERGVLFIVHAARFD